MHTQQINTSCTRVLPIPVWQTTLWMLICRFFGATEFVRIDHLASGSGSNE